MNGQNDKHPKNVAANGEQIKPVHEINLLSREKMSISGVKEVLSFDNSGAVLNTVDGELTVEGAGIRIGTLDTACGRVTINGRIDGMYYSVDTPERKKGMFGKLFG